MGAVVGICLLGAMYKGYKHCKDGDDSEAEEEEEVEVAISPHVVPPIVDNDPPPSYESVVRQRPTKTKRRKRHRSDQSNTS